MNTLMKLLPVAAGLGVAVISYKLLDEYVIKPLYKDA